MHLQERQIQCLERDIGASYGTNMADDAREVRVVEQLKVKIGELKNLTGRNNGTTTEQRRVYCTIALDQEEICRTPTFERTLSPFIGEEYQFSIPRKFRYLTLYVKDRDRHSKQDKAIGKVAIRREELHIYNNKENWFPLRPVDADSEVQGKVNILMMLCSSRCPDNDMVITDDYGSGNSENIFRNYSSSSVLIDTSNKNSHQSLKLHQQYQSEVKSLVAIRVAECVDLTKKNGTCDPYVVFTAEYSNDRKISKRTKVRKKTVNPKFDEIVYFDLSTHIDSRHDSMHTRVIYPDGFADLTQICISVYHDGANESFLGEIKIPMRGKQQQNAIQSDAWYFLQPRTSQSRPAQSCATPPGTRLSCDNSLGSLRLNLVYTADHVFPLATYDKLMDLLLESVNKRPITFSSVYILGEIISNKTDIAQPLVRIFTNKNKIAPIIKALADHEISTLTDATTIFRGNTLVSKMMDEAMRLSGLRYLHNTLRPVLNAILSEKKPCEIDPARVKDRSLIDTNLLNLQEYVEKVFDAITRSAVRCPAVLCQMFHDLRECAAKHFPQNKEVRYSVVSGFIFLRFFAPAILGPKLFDLTSEPLDSQTTRTLTLISKTIQSLGNLVSSRSAQQPAKEEYMGELYKKFCTEKHVEAVKHFLEVISTIGTNDSEQTNLEPVLLKEGMMAKRAQRQKIFGGKNFKQKYFRLTTQSLSYAKSKGKRPICDIPLSEILAVERLHEQSFKMQNIFQIVRKERRIYVQTTNCVEEKEWVDLLSKICQSNAARLQYFHPCAYVNGMWNCCSKSDENSDGCTQVSNTPFQMELARALDPARDLQRIHTLIMTCSQQQKDNHMRAFENDNICIDTWEKISEVAIELDQVHRHYKQRIARETKYGSRDAPIGDDNYLHMIRNAYGSSLAQSLPKVLLSSSVNSDHLTRC